MAQKFLTDIEVTQGLVDSSGDLGVAGQVLSSTGTAINWITNEANSTVVYQDGFTGDNSTVDFTLSVSVTDENITQVYLDGVYQHKDTYSVSNTTLTFSTAPPLNADIEVITFSTATTSDDLQAGVMIIPVKNTHTASIDKGEPVYITGNVGSSARLQIAPADASNSAKMPAAGLLLQTLAVNAEGYVVTGGYLRNLTTDTIDGTSTSSNDTVYVKAGGGLTMTKPTGTNLIQNIAKVARVASGNAGSLIVSSILRTNDVPNITNDYFWLGNSSGVATPTEFTSSVRGLISVSGNAISYNSSTGVITANYEESPTFTGDVIISGNLTVNGTQTILSTQTVEVEDNILQLNTTQGSPDTATATTSGISIYRGNGVTQASFIFDDADDTWDLTNNLAVAGNATFVGTIDAGGRVKVSGGNTDQYYFEGSRNGVGVTYRLYDNANTIYHDSWASQVFRLNQIGGSGGNLIITGGNVGIGETPSTKFTVNALATASNNDTPLTVSTIRGGVASNVRNTELLIQSTRSDTGGNRNIILKSQDVGGTSRSLILDASAVGIGTSSPDYKLDIRSGELAVRSGSSGNGGLAKLGNSSSNAILQLYDSSGNEDVRISTSLSSYFNGGNIGINQTSPASSKFTNSNNIILDISGNAVNRGGVITLRTSDNSKEAFLANDGGLLQIGMYTNNDVTFYTNNTERMRITSGGYILTGGRTSATGGWGVGSIEAERAVGAFNSNKTIYLFNNGTSIKLDAYDYGASSALDINIGGNGGDIILNGDVGIGTTSTQGKLTVVGTTQTIVADLTANTAVGLSVMGVDSNNFNAITLGSANSTNNCGVIRFKYNGAGSTNNYMGLGFYANDDILTVKGNGRVGINQITPAAELHIEGGGGDGQAMLKMSASTTGGTFNWASSTVYPNIGTGKTIINLFGHAQSLNNQAYIGFKYAGSSSTSNQLTLGFYANDFLVNLLANGNFGIGTASPSHKLDVNGDAKFVSNSSARVLYLKQDAVNSGNIIQFLDQNGSNIWEVVGRNNQFYIYNNALGNFPLYVNPSNSDIGIGKSSPNQKLDVNGNIGIPGAGKIVINNEPTAWFFQGRTTDSTSFLSTNLKNLLYCGGGVNEGFAITGTGTGDASFEIKNNGDAKIKTRLGIGTTDYQNSVLRAAGTISLESLGYDTFDPLNTGTSNLWSKIGTWYTAQGGRNLSIKLSAGAGYNASLSQNGEVYIELRTSNGAAAAPNISGRYWTLGQNEYISNVRVKEINQGEYEIYIQASAYIGQGQIQAVHSLTDRFDRSISHNTGAPSGSILSPSKYYYLKAPFYCYYDITTTEDIYIDSGTNYNDIGYLYLSNGRSSVSSEVVSGTAQGDTNLAFTTRYNGSAHTAGTFTHFGYFKAKGRNKSSFTYGSGYTFHNIESHEANEPTLVVHNSITTGEMYGINVIHTNDRNNTTSRFYAGQGAGTERIKIYSNGNIQNSNNSYGQLSDETIKENIVDATPKLDEINQVRVVNFNYIDDVDEETGIPNKQIGVVAQELEQIFPGLVYEAGNTEINENGKEIPTGETTKAVKYSVFVPMLIKAVQELTQEVQTLKNQINGIN